MGIFSDYLNKNLSFEDIETERKKQLQRIADIRERDILVYACDLNKGNTPALILSADLLPFKDQLSYIKTKDIDLIIETPGGSAETVEDIVELIRAKYERVGIIIPGTAKSAGTIFAMAADEILMGDISALGPIDAQLLSNNGKRISADAYLDGLNKIKKEVEDSGKLNPALIPILQNISPGDIQHFENAQNFSKTLVKNWLKSYKFKYWKIHSSTGKEVTEDDKEIRATEIADKLCKHSDWLTHGRSIRIKDLKKMRLEIINYSDNKSKHYNNDLHDAIDRYYTLLRMTFDSTGIFKIFETAKSHIIQTISQQKLFKDIPQKSNQIKSNKPSSAIINFVCPKCSTHHKIQLNFIEKVQTADGVNKYPPNDNFICKNCGCITNINSVRLQIEAQTGLKVIY